MHLIRLARKPWTPIQLMRQLHAKPYLYHHVLQKYTFELNVGSSEFLATYFSMVHDRARMQITQCKMEDTRHGQGLATFTGSKSLIFELLESVTRISQYTHHFGVMDDVLREKMRYRLSQWAIEALSCTSSVTRPRWGRIRPW